MYHSGYPQTSAQQSGLSNLRNVRCGSKTVLTASKRRFRLTPINGHRQTGAVGPFRATSGHHYFESEIDFATARAERMNCWASGLGVRFLTVMTSTEPSTVGILTGNILSNARLALNRATEPGRSPTNLPVATIVVVN